MTINSASATQPARSEPAARILVVDDQPDALEAMQAMLSSLGEEVLTASSAKEALKCLLKHSDVAVIVLDVVMPETDGFQLASIIRKWERFRHTPIIFLSGLYKEDNHMLRGYRAGAADYMLKPCDPDVLRYKVKTFIDLAKQSEMLRHYADLVEQNNQELQDNGRKLEDALDRMMQANAELEREVAQRREAENHRDRLASKLSAFPDFIEAMAEGAVTLAQDQSILYCNSRFAAMLNAVVGEVLGRPLGSFLDEAGKKSFTSLFGQLQEVPQKAELDLVAKDGSTIPAQIALSRFRGDECDAVAMVVTDLRDYRRNQELLAQGRLARHILEQSSSAIAVCDTDGRITLPSSFLAELCLTNPQFKAFDELFSLELGSGQIFSVAKVRAGNAYRGEEAIFRRADGRVFTLLLSADPVSANGDGVVGCVVTLFDISGRKQIEVALRRADKIAAAGRIAGALAHEVNNPLTAIVNLLFLIQENGSLDTQPRLWLDTACAELERVSQIVRKTLAFYRDPSRPAPVTLTAVLDNSLELFAGKLVAKQIRVRKRYRYQDTVVAYAGELRQVFSNLISNAIDALPSGGTLQVDISAWRDWHNSATPGVRVIIADNGVGIPKENQPHLFEPFFTTKGDDGTGLGLWVAEGIVQKHGGSIRVRSTTAHERSGTLFSVFLPLPAAANNAAAGTSSSETERAA
jgi:signal transduction histidine kinase/DNA-binding response OmpR family regulator